MGLVSTHAFFLLRLIKLVAVNFSRWHKKMRMEARKNQMNLQHGSIFFIYGNLISNFNHVQSFYKGMGDFSRRSTWCFACCNCVASHCSFGTYQCITSHLRNIIQTFGRTWSSGELGSRFAKSICVFVCEICWRLLIGKCPVTVYVQLFLWTSLRLVTVSRSWRDC